MLAITDTTNTSVGYFVFRLPTMIPGDSQKDDPTPH